MNQVEFWRGKGIDLWTQTSQPQGTLMESKLQWGPKISQDEPPWPPKIASNLGLDHGGLVNLTIHDIFLSHIDTLVEKKIE